MKDLIERLRHVIADVEVDRGRDPGGALILAEAASNLIAALAKAREMPWMPVWADIMTLARESRCGVVLRSSSDGGSIAEILITPPEKPDQTNNLTIVCDPADPRDPDKVIEAFTRPMPDFTNSMDIVMTADPAKVAEALKKPMPNLAREPEQEATGAAAKLRAIAQIDPSLRIKDEVEMVRWMAMQMRRWEAICQVLGICATKDPPQDIAGFVDTRAGGKAIQDAMREELRLIKPNSFARTVPSIADVLEFMWHRKRAADLAHEPQTACTGDVPPTEQGAVETKFVELFYLDNGRTGLRFEGMADIYVPDADAHRLARAVRTGGESQVKERESKREAASVGQVSPPDRERGLYNKYIVKRADGRADDGADYFVLRLDKPGAARKAMAAYVDAVEAEYPLLAHDLRVKYKICKGLMLPSMVWARVCDAVQAAGYGAHLRHSSDDEGVAEILITGPKTSATTVEKTAEKAPPKDDLGDPQPAYPDPEAVTTAKRWASLCHVLGISSQKDPPTDIAGFIDAAGPGPLMQEALRQRLRRVTPSRGDRVTADLEGVLRQFMKSEAARDENHNAHESCSAQLHAVVNRVAAALGMAEPSMLEPGLADRLANEIAKLRAMAR